MTGKENQSIWKLKEGLQTASLREAERWEAGNALEQIAEALGQKRPLDYSYALGRYCSLRGVPKDGEIILGQVVEGGRMIGELLKEFPNESYPFRNLLLAQTNLLLLALGFEAEDADETHQLSQKILEDFGAILSRQTKFGGRHFTDLETWGAIVQCQDDLSELWETASGPKYLLTGWQPENDCLLDYLPRCREKVEYFGNWFLARGRIELEKRGKEALEKEDPIAYHNVSFKYLQMALLTKKPEDWGEAREAIDLGLNLLKQVTEGKVQCPQRETVEAVVSFLCQSAKLPLDAKSPGNRLVWRKADGLFGVVLDLMRIYGMEEETREWLAKEGIRFLESASLKEHLKKVRNLTASR